MKFTATILTASLAAVGSAVAQVPDFPSTGMVYNTIDAASLTHFCKLSADRYSMDCEFTQTSVRRKLDAEEAAKKLAAAKAEFISKPQQVSAKDCADYENFLLAMQGKKAPPEAMAKMSPREKADGIAMIGHIVSFCRAPNLDNWMKFVSVGIDKERRTCSVSSNAFKQRFRRTDTGSWTVVAEADGPCGIVRLDRFEPEKSSNITFWNYFSRKAVTNPRGNAGLLSCNGLDEREYKFQWQKRDPDLSCEYVEFSPI